MKAVLLSARDGSISVAEIPPPVVQWGAVLIRNTYSLISAGTERATLETGASSLMGKARQRPDQVRQVLNTARQLGVVETYRMVQDRLDRPMTLGYSCAGEVIAVGEGVDDIAPGMRVAAGGAGYASHAEIVAVPRNLVVPVPEGVEDRWAAFATVGAIALQGIHQTEAVPGSRVVVIGLGLVGQLTLRLLRAYGYDTVGVDQDPAAIDAARTGGFVAHPRQTEDLAGTVARHWGGARADAVLVTAATSSTDPVELAGTLARDRATVVIVGDVKVSPPRSSYYHKELSVRYSRSYGPGRYDPRFEEAGDEYPEGYVPWTERRNLAEVLRLVPRLDLESLDPRVFAVEDAAEAYRVLNTERPRRRAALLLRYPGTAEMTEPPRYQGRPATWSPPAGEARIAAIGAGNFATKMLFPHLRRDGNVRFSWVASARGLTAVQQSRRWGSAASRRAPSTDSRRARPTASWCCPVMTAMDATRQKFCVAASRCTARSPWVSRSRSWRRWRPPGPGPASRRSPASTGGSRRPSGTCVPPCPKGRRSKSPIGSSPAGCPRTTGTSISGRAAGCSARSAISSTRRTSSSKAGR